jgi:hypothetical protein
LWLLTKNKKGKVPGIYFRAKKIKKLKSFKRIVIILLACTSITRCHRVGGSNNRDSLMILETGSLR